MILGLNIYYDSGTEFYNKKILGLISPYLNYSNIDHKVLTKEEIEQLTRKVKHKNDSQIINYDVPNTKSNIIPNEHQ